MPDRKYTKRDETLEPLLNLDGEIFLLERGFLESGRWNY